MDLLEKLFYRVSGWVRRQEGERQDACAVLFEDLFPSLVALAQGAVSKTGINIQLKEYDGFGALYENTLLLPIKMSTTRDQELNRQIFLHKALVGGILRDGGVITQAKASSWAQRSFQVALLREYVKNRASRIFPKYLEWAQVIEERLAFALSNQELAKADQAWLRIEARFKKEIASESEKIARAGRMDRKALEKWERALSPELLRELDSLPRVALALGCEPGLSKTLLHSETSEQDSNRKKSENQTEQEGHVASEIEVIDLEKEKKKDNPVTHSFEKLETADDYQGGYKGADGSDELQEHSNALEEVEMKKVTRGGEAAGSTYRADISELVYTKESAATQPKKITYQSYPEWDYHRKKMIPDHCRLYLELPPHPEKSQGQKWKDEVLARHERGLEEWKHRLSMLVNERRIRDRQWEGTDISIDAFVRYVGDAKHSGSGDARLYVKSFAGIRDFSCLILLDQSFSTDSWVMNRRVLDVELESLALVSELLSPLNEPVAIAGTWSETRNHCHFKMYKDFNHPWQRLIDHAPEIEPRGYTRLGPAVRHSTKLLSERGGKHKLLILLTDGKPTDYDRYEGRYGIEDIHHACLEAAQLGISVRALAVEKEAKNYFPYLFGPRDYQILQNPDELPERLFRIYLESIRR